MRADRKKTKILYIVNHFKVHGGIERMLSNKIDAWIENFGYDVTVITLFQEELPIVYPTKHEFKLIDLNLKNLNNANPIKLIYFIYKLKNLINGESPNIIFTSLTGVPALILPLITGDIRTVLEIHSSGKLSVSKSWKYKWIFLNKYFKVVVLNEDEKKYYRLSNLMVIPNFTNVTDRNICYANREKVIIAAGRIHPDKQFDHLIKIWEKIAYKHKDWRLEIYGSGNADLIENLKKYIRDKCIINVSLNESINNLEDKLMNSSILCLCSKTESFSMILIECKKYMLPAISYDSPTGPRHVIKNDGILVEHDNINQFADELDSLITNEDYRTRLANNAFNNRYLFSSKEIIKEWNSLLN